MADTGVFCTTAQIQHKAGANASATSKAEAYTNDYVAQAEAFINVMCRYDFTTNYASLGTYYKQMLAEVASNLAAIYVIEYDMSGFTSRSEAESMINVLRDAAMRGMSVLRDKKVQDKMLGSGGG